MPPLNHALMRGRAAINLHDFSTMMFAARRGFPWINNWHHHVVCDALMRVYLGQCRRLIINIPPRYSKTELAVINFMAWALGREPDAEFIHVSYAAELAALNAMQAREMVLHEEYRAIFPHLQLRDDMAARNHWRTTAGGVVYATGAQGTITGFGAGKVRKGFGGCIIIDDPHKADEALSEVNRPKVIRWYQNTLTSRLNDPKRTPIILIMQRLHEEDLAGWLLAGGTGEHWEHISLPAIQPDGTALWPAKHDIAELRRMEEASPYNFAGQYQQRPTPAEGGLFKPDMLQVVDSLEGLNIRRWVRAWDLAATHEDGDHTVGVLMGEREYGAPIIADIVRLQGRPDDVERAILSCATRDGKGVQISIPEDPGQAGKFQAEYLIRKLVQFRAKADKETGDKITRAEPLASQVNVGNVMMLRADWNAALVHEMRHFPFGTYDDQVDACSRAFKFLGENKGPVIITPDALRMAAMKPRRAHRL